MIRRGLTLPEVIIAMGLFVVAMSLVMEGMVASHHTASHEAAHDDVAIDASRAIAEIAQDLALSGWDIGTNVSLPVQSLATDRNKTYYPFVQLQDQGGGPWSRSGTQFQHTWRGPGTGSPTFVMLNPQDTWPSVPGQPADRTANWNEYDPLERGKYIASYFARSQELIFVRQVMSGGWPADPRLLERPSVNFRGTIAQWRDSKRGHTTLGILYPSGWVDTRNPVTNLITYSERSAGALYGVPMLPAVLIEDDGTLNMRRVWEGYGPPDYTTLEVDPMTGNVGRRNPITNALDTSLPPVREYQYAVVPSRSSLGRLVRAYSTTASGFPVGTDPGQAISSANGVTMVVDKVISEDVVRAVFDTWRTDDTLDVDDIRVRLYLARPQRSDATGTLVVHRLVETIVQMRAKCAELDRAGDAGATDSRGTLPVTTPAWRLDL